MYVHTNVHTREIHHVFATLPPFLNSFSAIEMHLPRKESPAFKHGCGMQEVVHRYTSQECQNSGEGKTEREQKQMEETLLDPVEREFENAEKTVLRPRKSVKIKNWH